MNSSKNKSNSPVAPLRNDPFPYCHLYKLSVGTNHGRAEIPYVLHCDYPQPADKRNIAEIKRRLGWSITPLHIYKINVVKRNYYGSKQQGNDKRMVTQSKT